MKKLAAYLKEHKTTLIIALLLAILIIIAALLYGNKSKISQASSYDTTRSTSEIKLMRILSDIDGVGQADVMINEGRDGIEGIIIVCEGANNIMTRNDVLNAVKTAFNVEKNNIAIYAMNK